MHAFLISNGSKEQQEVEIEKLLKPFSIDPIDVARIIPKGSIGIEAVRILKQEVALKPFKSETKAVVIEDAQTLTIEAQNALLKTLEEPPTHTIIILLVLGSTSQLLPTILSRVHTIEIPHEKVTLPEKELSTLNSQLSTLLTNGGGEKLKLAEDLAKDKESLLSWLEKMILATRQNLIDDVFKNKDNLQITQLLHYAISLQRAHTLIATTNVNPRFTLETILLNISATID